MDLFSSVILGIVQGLTEFIPVSSSGHLIIARDLLRVPLQGSLAFDAVLQLATSFAILIYFRKVIYRLIVSMFQTSATNEIAFENRVLLWALIIGTIPAIVAGLFLEKYMETLFRSGFVVAIMLVLGSIILAIAEYFAKQNAALTPKKAIVIGLFQILALVPGMSRSGMTISGGLLTGLTREKATQFSFLLAFPIIFGSGLKKLIDLYRDSQIGPIGGELFIGSIVAFFVGWWSITFLMRYVKSHTFRLFIYYRLVLAVFIFIYFLLK